jgi:hypothetical protein
MYEYVFGPSIAGITAGLIIQLIIVVIFAGVFKDSPVDQFIFFVVGFISFLAGPLVSWFAARKDWRAPVFTFVVLFIIFWILFVIFGPEEKPKLTL